MNLIRAYIEWLKWFLFDWSPCIEDEDIAWV